jgi:hypothetical protein
MEYFWLPLLAAPFDRQSLTLSAARITPRVREDGPSFKNSVIAPQIRSRIQDKNRTPVAYMVDPSIVYILASGMVF